MDPEWKMPSTGSSADFSLDDSPIMDYDDNTENTTTKEVLENSPILDYGDNTEYPATKEIVDVSVSMEFGSKNLSTKETPIFSNVELLLDSKPAISANSKLDMKNIEIDINTFQDNNQNKDTKKSTMLAVRLYNEVMDELSQNVGNEFVPLDKTPVEMLPEKLCRFFMVLKKKDGKYYNASSIQMYYQSIAHHLQNADNHPVDIKRDSKFKCIRETVKIWYNESAEAGERPGKNASEAVSPEVLKKAYEEKSFGKSNPKALVTTVHFILMNGFGLRSIKESYNVLNADLIIGPEVREGLQEWIGLEKCVTKTRKGQKGAQCDVQARVWLDDENPQVCSVQTILEYKK